MAWGVFAVPLMVVLFKLYGLYDRDVKRITYSTVDDLPWLMHATLVGGLLYWVYSRVSPMGRLDFAEILTFGLGLIILTTIMRFVTRQLASRVIGVESVVVVGGGAMANVFASKVASHPEYRLRVIGALEEGPSSTDGGLPVLGAVADLDDIVASHSVGRVVITPHDVDDPGIEEVLRHCRALGLKVSILPRLSDVLGPAVEVDDVEGVTVLGINPPWLPRSSRAIKRLLDVFIAATLLVLLLPLMFLIAIAIKLDSAGPVIFAQTRVGRGGSGFRVLKFRTMTADAEQRRSELLSASADPNWLLLDRDPRITRLGGHLRRLSLDELPQLWNVLRGEMSMVGPRPLIPAEDELVKGWQRGRLDLTPGITGYWQVLGRTRIPFDEMIKLDYLYVMNWSLWEDIRLMLRTLPTVVSGRGVN